MEYREWIDTRQYEDLFLASIQRPHLIGKCEKEQMGGGINKKSRIWDKNNKISIKKDRFHSIALLKYSVVYNLLLLVKQGLVRLILFWSESKTQR